MTKDAEIFKSKNHLNYESLTMKDFNKFTAGEHFFDLICIKNKDSSVVNHFWTGHHDKVGLNLWSKITKKES
jgi:hypothetical protein